MKEFYISSTKYNIQERKTKKHGTVYDVVFRIVTLDGTEKQKKLSGYTTKTLAKQAYTEFVTEHCELVKNNPIKKKNTDKETPTVGELIRQYLATLSNQNKESSIYDKQNIYRLFVLPHYDDTKITALTKEELYLWQDKLWATKNPRTNDFYSYKYLYKVRTHFQAFLAWVESRYGFKNFFPEVAKPKRRTAKTKMEFWKREDFEKFISVIDDPMYHCLFTMMFFTGRRKGEIFALSPDDVQESTISFTKSLTRKTLDGSAYKITTTKTDKNQVVPICETLIKELHNYSPQTPFFFGGERPLAEKTVTRVFDRGCELAGVKRIRIHDLRHSFVSMLIHLGANLMVVADLIGDTVEQVTKTYGHLYESDKLDIISKIK